MTLLRDPALDTEHVLEPERLIALEREAEPARALLDGAGIRPEQASAVRAWILAELEVARRRAWAVNDVDFVECVALIERRLADPGCFLRSAEAALKIREVLGKRARFRVIEGGGTASSG